MENLDMTMVLTIAAIAFVLLILLLIAARKFYVNVGAREIAIKERRYLGRRMPPGRVVRSEEHTSELQSH